MSLEGKSFGVFFPTGRFSRKTYRVLVDGKPRTDYRVYYEEGTGRVMIYFDELNFQEQSSVQVQEIK